MTLFKDTPIPAVEPSAPTVAVIRPPEHVGVAKVHVPPVPVTVKLPPVSDNTIPLGAPLEEMLMKVAANVPVDRFTACPVPFSLTSETV
ncbi:MAG: hypothetical protein ACREBC_29600, partial [Pyrinomonadaceae bacterium]